ncbi:hypothetical protein RHGRI_031025 [Rhododendron griersonianum]|uniref:Pre-mRNA splicing factor n=1 Tax=Rhododendron griersonianum TaxID=479676 RepID=A0AAV6I687_9ERIC|nr:hypothetical protein RHGRI_031025 [Rhododendron griersonianum]
MVLHPQQRTRSMDVFKRCDHDPRVIIAIAKLFWNDRKVDEARSLLNRAVTLGPDVGDFWALFYKFELQHGTEETQADLLKRCIAAEPKHGEKWQAVSKAVENSHQPTEALLKKVVVALGKEGSSAQGRGCSLECTTTLLRVTDGTLEGQNGAGSIQFLLIKATC